jgi:predicted MFS family arabinose efflux permease
MVSLKDYRTLQPCAKLMPIEQELAPLYSPNNLPREKEASISSQVRYSSSIFLFLSLGILSCYVICGLVLAALGASVEDIAHDVGYAATDIAAIYVSRGFGSIIGSFLSGPLFSNFNAVKSLTIVYIFTIATIVFLPFISSLFLLHVAYFSFGAITSVIGSGSMVLIRKVHQDKAGPWIGAIGVALSGSGVLVTIVQIFVHSIRNQFFTYASLVCLGVVWLQSLPFICEDIHPSKNSHGGFVYDAFSTVDKSSYQSPGPSRLEGVASPCISECSNDEGSDPSPNYLTPPHYWPDALISLMVMSIVGGGAAFSIFLEHYVDSTSIFNEQYKATLLLVFFFSGTIANILGIFVQIDITDEHLVRLTYTALLVGSVGAVFPLIWPHSLAALCLCVSLFGFTNAIVVGFCFNIANRLVYPSALSTAIIMTGSSVGVAIIPYLTTVLWKLLDSPLVVMAVALFSMAIPISLLSLLPHLCYVKCRITYTT